MVEHRVGVGRRPGRPGRGARTGWWCRGRRHARRRLRRARRRPGGARRVGARPRARRTSSRDLRSGAGAGVGGGRVVPLPGLRAGRADPDVGVRLGRRGARGDRGERFRQVDAGSPAGRAAAARGWIGVGDAALGGPADSRLWRWRGRDLVRTIGTVFQDPEHQFVAATVRDELAVGPRRAGATARGDRPGRGAARAARG